VADRERAGQRLQIALRDRLGDEPHPRPALHVPAVRRADAGRFLPAVLLRIKAQVCQLGRIRVIGNAEQAAMVVDLG